jgi:hypothetical protein
VTTFDSEGRGVPARGHRAHRCESHTPLPSGPKARLMETRRGSDEKGRAGLPPRPGPSWDRGPDEAVVADFADWAPGEITEVYGL